MCAISRFDRITCGIDSAVARKLTSASISTKFGPTFGGSDIARPRQLLDPSASGVLGTALHISTETLNGWLTGKRSWLAAPGSMPRGIAGHVRHFSGIITVLLFITACASSAELQRSYPHADGSTEFGPAPPRQHDPGPSPSPILVHEASGDPASGLQSYIVQPAAVNTAESVTAAIARLAKRGQLSSGLPLRPPPRGGDRGGLSDGGAAGEAVAQLRRRRLQQKIRKHDTRDGGTSLIGNAGVLLHGGRAEAAKEGNDGNAAAASVDIGSSVSGGSGGGAASRAEQRGSSARAAAKLTASAGRARKQPAAQGDARAQRDPAAAAPQRRNDGGGGKKEASAQLRETGGGGRDGRTAVGRAGISTSRGGSGSIRVGGSSGSNRSRGSDLSSGRPNSSKGASSIRGSGDSVQGSSSRGERPRAATTGDRGQNMGSVGAASNSGADPSGGGKAPSGGGKASSRASVSVTSSAKADSTAQKVSATDGRVLRFPKHPYHRVAAFLRHLTNPQGAESLETSGGVDVYTGAWSSRVPVSVLYLHTSCIPWMW